MTISYKYEATTQDTDAQHDLHFNGKFTGIYIQVCSFGGGHIVMEDRLDTEGVVEEFFQASDLGLAKGLAEGLAMSKGIIPADKNFTRKK